MKHVTLLYESINERTSKRIPCSQFSKMLTSECSTCSGSKCSQCRWLHSGRDWRDSWCWHCSWCQSTQDHTHNCSQLPGPVWGKSLTNLTERETARGANYFYNILPSLYSWIKVWHNAKLLLLPIHMTLPTFFKVLNSIIIWVFDLNW